MKNSVGRPLAELHRAHDALRRDRIEARCRIARRKPPSPQTISSLPVSAATTRSGEAISCLPALHSSPTCMGLARRRRNASGARTSRADGRSLSVRNMSDARRAGKARRVPPAIATASINVVASGSGAGAGVRAAHAMSRSRVVVAPCRRAKAARRPLQSMTTSATIVDRLAPLATMARHPTGPRHRRRATNLSPGLRRLQAPLPPVLHRRRGG